MYISFQFGASESPIDSSELLPWGSLMLVYVQQQRRMVCLIRWQTSPWVMRNEGFRSNDSCGHRCGGATFKIKLRPFVPFALSSGFVCLHRSAWTTLVVIGTVRKGLDDQPDRLGSASTVQLNSRKHSSNLRHKRG